MQNKYLRLVSTPRFQAVVADNLFATKSTNLTCIVNHSSESENIRTTQFSSAYYPLLGSSTPSSLTVSDHDSSSEDDSSSSSTNAAFTKHPLLDSDPAQFVSSLENQPKIYFTANKLKRYASSIRNNISRYALHHPLLDLPAILIDAFHEGEVVKLMEALDATTTSGCMIRCNDTAFLLRGNGYLLW